MYMYVAHKEMFARIEWHLTIQWRGKLGSLSGTGMQHRLYM